MGKSQVQDVLTSLRLISRKDVTLAFDPVSLRFFQLESNLYALLQGIKTGELPWDTPKVQQSLPVLEHLVHELERVREGAQEIDGSYNPHAISRVTVHVTNDCNLRCSYCYANGGAYGMPRAMMTPQVASDLVEFLGTHFDYIDRVLFFGGEPLLNPTVIGQICEGLTEHHRNGNLKELPEFSVITNGTILNEQVLEVLRRYIRFVTVSIDGPQAPHDTNRRDAGGKPTWERVDGFIQRLQDETDISLFYEATYTAAHHEEGLQASDVGAFLQERYGIDGVIVQNTLDEWLEPPHRISSESDLEEVKRHLQYSETLKELLPSLIYGRHGVICQVGRGVVAIGTDGDISACHMLIGDRHLSLGSIYGDNLFDNREKYRTQRTILDLVTKSHRVCKSCWMRKLCSGCAVNLFFCTETREFVDAPVPERCEAMASTIEDALVALARMRSDPSAWRELLAFEHDRQMKRQIEKC